MNKDYSVEIEIKFCEVVSADNKKLAIEKVKSEFYEDYGLDLVNREIKKVERI